MSLKSKVSSRKSSASTVGRRTGKTLGSRLQTPDSKLLTRDLPFVLINMAMTADGKIATANRALSSFGSKRDHDHLLELRATADAVMAGARTVDLNKINLGPGPEKFRRARLRRGLAEFNLRIIVSGSGSINPDAEIFKHRLVAPEKPRGEFLRSAILNRSRGRESALTVARDEARRLTSAATNLVENGRCVATSPIIILTTQRASKSKLKELRSLADEVKSFGKTEINFRAALRWLHSRLGVKRLLCEGGGELNDALLRAGLVDELHLTVCPKIFGGRAAPTIAEGLGFLKLAHAAPLKLKSARRVGAEMFLVFARA